jgi:hypothetical protein
MKLNRASTIKNIFVFITLKLKVFMPKDSYFDDIDEVKTYILDQLSKIIQFLKQQGSNSNCFPSAFTKLHLQHQCSVDYVNHTIASV